MTPHPSPDECLARLHAAGWSIGDVRPGNSFLVTGANGENLLHAVGATSAETWRRACEQAEAVGMLGRQWRR
jgi:hypothetical protein